ncbi:endonuclease/exonuclease/phosphatase family protein [Sulfitobacter sp. JB4-11]|uniref:endonuclease/exonuclease/phosphatase family protein n=1 Tax=Sulfitobacter rhodophyticola TaxID=3238304 RepID=UPI003512F6E5
MNWNLEWMNHWFSGNDNPRWGSSSLTAAEAQICAQKAARVIDQINPDLLCLQEGPSATAEMDLFLRDHLNDQGAPKYEAIIGLDGGAQKLFVLRRLDGVFRAMDRATDPLTEGLAELWDADVNGDMLLEGYDFTRLPLVVDVDPIGGAPIRIVVLHTKSKFVRFGRQKWEDPNRRQEFVVQALEARRRISAEGFRLRTYLDALVAAEGDARIVVTGDWNDGPGRDLFERSYLTHNVADIVLGSTFTPELIFHHPLLAHVQTPSLFTARFDDYVDDVQDRPLLLDHFAVSPGLTPFVANAQIAHAAYDNEVEGDGRDRIQRPSDHRPIVLDLEAPLTG